MFVGPIITLNKQSWLAGKHGLHDCAKESPAGGTKRKREHDDMDDLHGEQNIHVVSLLLLLHFVRLGCFELASRAAILL